MENKPWAKVMDLQERCITMQKLGGFFKKGSDGKRYWYPERLILLTDKALYQYIPDEKSIPVLPTRRVLKKSRP